MSAVSSISPPRAQLMMRTPILGLGEVRGGEDVARLVGQRRVQRDEVGAAQQGLELDLLHPHLDRALGREEGIIGDHLHPQPQRAIGDDAADIARADQPDGLAGQLDAHEAVLLPLARLRRGVGLGQLAGEREHQRDGMLGGGDRVAERCVHHDHALGRGRGDIDIVDADAGTADHLEVGGGLEDRLGDLGRAADREPVVFADDRDQLLGRLAGDLVDLDAALAEYLRGLWVHLVADKYLGHFPTFVIPRESGDPAPAASANGAGWRWVPAFAGGDGYADLAAE